jgi:hypothetical protein
MTRWAIDTIAVQGVLAKAGGEAQDMTRAVAAVNGSLEAAASVCGSELVTDALLRFGQSHQAALTGIERHTEAALRQTARATSAYAAGDLRMAETAQHAAERANEDPPRGRPPSGQGQKGALD